VVLDGCKW
jgi:hypothetical protein